MSGHALQLLPGRMPAMRMNFGSAPTKTTSRFPLHQRQVAHFFCPIGISTRPPKTKKAFSVAILQRRLVCPDGIRQRRTPQGSAVFSIFRSIRMITSLSEERVSVFYQLPNNPARTNRQRIGHTSHIFNIRMPQSQMSRDFIFYGNSWNSPRKTLMRIRFRPPLTRASTQAPIITAHAGAGRP